VPLVEQLAQQVLAEHPNSARAHYYLAQAYLHENRQADALAQLQKAQQLDSTLGLAASAVQFNKMLAQAQQGVGGGAQVQYANVVQVQPTQHSADSSNAVWWLLGAGLVVVMVSVLIINSVAKRRRELETSENNRLLAQIEAERAKKGASTVTDEQLEQADWFAQRANYFASDTLPKRADIYCETAPAPRVVNNYYPNSNAQRTSSGSTVGGFVAGAAVGYLANEMLSNHHHSSSSSDNNPSWDNSSSSSNWDAGSSSNSWDSSSSSSWDSSSSSSWDSGSGSSDWGSSSSSDNGRW